LFLAMFSVFLNSSDTCAAIGRIKNRYIIVNNDLICTLVKAALAAIFNVFTKVLR
jgi:hypothetical protein